MISRKKFGCCCLIFFSISAIGQQATTLDFGFGGVVGSTASTSGTPSSGLTFSITSNLQTVNFTATSGTVVVTTGTLSGDCASTTGCSFTGGTLEVTSGTKTLFMGSFDGTLTDVSRVVTITANSGGNPVLAGSVFVALSVGGSSNGDFTVNAATAVPIATIEQPMVPTSAQPGGANFTLTINGANFFPAPTDVLWQQGTTVTSLPISSSTPTQLTVAVPAKNIASAGTSFVSVLNSSGLVSNTAFFQIATPASPQFGPPVDYSPGLNTVETVHVGDFNGDGILDLAVGVEGGSTANIQEVAILLGNSDGTFQSPATYSVDNASSIVAGRFNNNGGSIDLVAGDTLLVNNGQGIFTATQLPTAGFIPYAVGDFAQTGVLDIAGLSGSDVQILNNNGAGVFTVGQNFTGFITEPGGMLAADFNGDGVLDLAVLDTFTGLPAVRVFLGSTTAGFNGGNPIVTGTPTGVVAFTAADFNQDNKQDIALVHNSGGPHVLILNGNGDGTFTSGFTEALANTVTGSVVTADFNEDGKVDLATGTYILQGNGDGTFQTPTNFGGTAEVLATGDFNGDGRPDLVAQASPDVAVLLQQIPVVSLLPASLAFGSQVVGTTSAAQQITLSNTGSGALAIELISITGTNASEFSESNACSTSLAPGSSCTINVTFTPTAAGPATASVSITDNAAGSPQMVSLSGTGQTGMPAVMLSPSPLNFTPTQPQLVGTSASLPVTLTNSGSAALVITAIAFTGANASEFTQSNTCPASLAPSANCTINVTFTPTTGQSATASLSLSDNAGNSPQLLPITGTVQNFSLTTTCTSLTVVPGQSAIYTVDLGPVNGFTGSVSLSCSGAPALATCTVLPTSMTLDGSTTVRAQVTATTTQAMSLLKSPLGHSNENRLVQLAELAGLAGLAGLVVLPGKRRVKSLRRFYGWIFLMCVVAAVATLPACGARHDPPGTAAGTYPLTVTGAFQPPTGPPITETVSFNLVVQ